MILIEGFIHMNDFLEALKNFFTSKFSRKNKSFKTSDKIILILILTIVAIGIFNNLREQ